MRFALISDQHFGPPAYHDGKMWKLTGEAERLTRAFVERMNTVDQPDLVINLGDVVEDASPEIDRHEYGRFVELLSRCRAELLHVAGNHEQINLTDDELCAFWQHDGPLYYSRDFGGVHCSILRTIEIKDTAVHLPEEQIEWLARDLERAAYPTIVLMHHPASEMLLTGNHWFEHAPHICHVIERRRLRSVLESSGKVAAVFNGHAHWNHLDVIQGIPYVTVQSLTENLVGQSPGWPAAAWAVCDIDESRLAVHVQGVEPVRYQFELGRRG
jgi:predicted phosphodiesterase